MYIIKIEQLLITNYYQLNKIIINNILCQNILLYVLIKDI